MISAVASAELFFAHEPYVLLIHIDPESHHRGQNSPRAVTLDLTPLTSATCESLSAFIMVYSIVATHRKQ